MGYLGYPGRRVAIGEQQHSQEICSQQRYPW
jgi:hypothetical protein